LRDDFDQAQFNNSAWLQHDQSLTVLPSCFTSNPDLDCNRNGILDACDMREGRSQDWDQDGIPDECSGTRFHRGDPNDDGRLAISDAIFVLDYLFSGGREPDCRDAADADNDGSLTIGDGISILGFAFLGGPPPADPGPPGRVCGTDPDARGSAKDLGCQFYCSCSPR
jgi:hypothetical protein